MYYVSSYMYYVYLDGREQLLIGILVWKFSAQGCDDLALGFRLRSFGRQCQNHRTGEWRRYVIEIVTGRGLQGTKSEKKIET